MARAAPPHVIKVYSTRTDTVECSCGEIMAAGSYADHRKAMGAKKDPKTRAQPQWGVSWKTTSTRVTKPRAVE